MTPNPQHHHPQTVVMGSSSRTLTNAPPLTTLADLDHEWRIVAFVHGPPIWKGDLHLPDIQKRFRRMISDGRVILLTHRTHDGDLLFAKLAENRNQTNTQEIKQ